MPRLFTRLLAAATCLPLLLGCGTREPNAEVDTSRAADFGFQTNPQTALLLDGKKAYEQYCIGCHGVAGDGLGEAARFLNPKPRSFVKADFKFSTTRAGQLPTDEDLFRTLSTGLRGSSMPSWSFLPERTRWALVAYVKTFSPKWQTFGRGSPIPFFTDPYADQIDKSAAVRRGEQAYHGFFRCWACHPAYVDERRISQYLTEMGAQAQESYRPGLQHSDIKATSDGDTIFAPDFLRDYVRAGVTVKDLYRSIAAGISGTAMPTWVDTMEDPPKDAAGKPIVGPGDLWAVAYYVHDLLKRRTPRLPIGSVVVRDLREIRFQDGGAVYVNRVPGLDAAEEEEE